MFSLFSNRNKDLSNCVFDYDAYYDDIRRNIPFKEQMKKFKNFSYYVDKSVMEARKHGCK